LNFFKKAGLPESNGRRAYLENNASKELLDWVSKSLLQIDAISLTQGGFWEEELSSFSE
jgi:hypothetical protein